MAALITLVWRVWRSGMRFSLKAATLSAAALVATPYAFGYDLAALAIPVAFLAKDQMKYGLLRGEQTVLIVLFGASLVALTTFLNSPIRDMVGSAPVGPILVAAILALVLRRDVMDGAGQPAGDVAYQWRGWLYRAPVS
jgi:hypothetical protein